jgi:hypothetical protein
MLEGVFVPVGFLRSIFLVNLLPRLVFAPRLPSTVIRPFFNRALEP